jgi:hypothetical protein
MDREPVAMSLFSGERAAATAHLVRLVFSISDWTTAACGTFGTCPPILRMSVHQGRPEVAVVRPNRRK